MQHSSVVDRGRRPSAATRRKSPGFSRAWCCSFAAAPGSPDPRAAPSPKPHVKPVCTGSPSPSAKRIIDPRRILSPGRVSPLPQTPSPPPLDPPPGNRSPPLSRPEPPSPVARVSPTERRLDLRLSLKGKDGKVLVLELDSKVLCESSSFFAAMVLEARRKVSDVSTECRKIEVAGVEDLVVFKETIELMYEKDATQWLMNAGVSRAIGILEVSSTIMFDRGVTSCLKYLEAVPWSESEEEKLKSLFTRCVFDEEVSRDVLARLGEQGPNKSEDLAVRLIQSVASGTNSNARRELQSLVNGLLSKSSVYQKDPAGLNKENLYNICDSCLNSLVELFEEASDSVPACQTPKSKETKPLVERVSKEAENLNWLLEILIDKQMGEDFVGLWANQAQLIMMHERASPMIRYELSRISASVFIALGKGKVQCKGEVRSSVLLSWFAPMLLDFGWLQRCSKGLDMRMLEEGLGQALLTLPLKQQQSLFVEWFQCFSLKGTECPNLGKAFQHTVGLGSGTFLQTPFGFHSSLAASKPSFSLVYESEFSPSSRSFSSRGLFGSMASGDLEEKFSVLEVGADPLCNGSTSSSGNGVMGVDDDGAQITCFSEDVHDVVIHFQIIRLSKQIFVWIGCNSAKFGHMHAAAPTRPMNTVSVASLLGGGANSTGSSIARRLALKTGVNVVLACNIPNSKDSPMLEAAAERKLMEKLRTLGYITRPASQNTSVQPRNN
ncbi:hypothetical protein J5N97_021079 [Dioscorea zingiberensis]|uniref:At3g05675-like ankyrin-like domain-containing protein n=1 Tax=Dioscorea zingiberensis TaxID=325984 RepID=A0A9D5CJ84_9LILI|nr:hypothetical protein J5N97_021079 [Dioscorea zingiberensis]